MRKALAPAQRGLTKYDRARLRRALRHAEDVRVFQRAQALLLVAEGHTLAQAAHVTGLSRPTVYFWLKRYVQQRRIEALRDGPRRGRPPAADRISPEQILLELGSPPSDWGYSRPSGVDWAEVLRRTFDFDVFACVRCGGRRRLLAYVKQAGAVRAILEHLGLPTAGASLTPAPAPPQSAWC